jgi:hypothetical protein
MFGNGNNRDPYKILSNPDPTEQKYLDLIGLGSGTLLKIQVGTGT